MADIHERSSIFVRLVLKKWSSFVRRGTTNCIAIKWQCETRHSCEIICDDSS